VNVLRKLRQVLVPGGVIIDTQPVSRQPPVKSGRGILGKLDMTEWGRTIETIDRRTRRAIREGLFGIDHHCHVAVADLFDTGAELLAEISSWAGTSIDPLLAEQIEAEQRPVRVEQRIRLRVLRARR
jgi:hypothetical protein